MAVSYTGKNPANSDYVTATNSKHRSVHKCEWFAIYFQRSCLGVPQDYHSLTMRISCHRRGDTYFNRPPNQSFLSSQPHEIRLLWFIIQVATSDHSECRVTFPVQANQVHVFHACSNYIPICSLLKLYCLTPNDWWKQLSNLSNRVVIKWEMKFIDWIYLIPRWTQWWESMSWCVALPILMMVIKLSYCAILHQPIIELIISTLMLGFIAN